MKRLQQVIGNCKDPLPKVSLQCYRETLIFSFPVRTRFGNPTLMDLYRLNLAMDLNPFDSIVTAHATSNKLLVGWRCMAMLPSMEIFCCGWANHTLAQEWWR